MGVYESMEMFLVLFAPGENMMFWWKLKKKVFIFILFETQHFFLNRPSRCLTASSQVAPWRLTRCFSPGHGLAGLVTPRSRHQDRLLAEALHCGVENSGPPSAGAGQ